MSRPLPDSVLDRIADVLIAASERMQREAEENAKNSDIARAAS
jgi:hypothetical protein